MRKFGMIYMLILAVVLTASCSMGMWNGGQDSSIVDDGKPVTELYFRSNVDAIEKGVTKISARSNVAGEGKADMIIGEPIVGVLLTFSAATEFGYGADVCYLQYLGDGVTKDNGDGSLIYNYILFCPPIIQETYYEGRGIEAFNTGNAFWWYMHIYFDLDINEIQEDWYSALDILLGKDELPLPNAADVPEDWKEPLPVLPDVPIPSFDSRKEIIVLTELHSPITQKIDVYACDKMTYSPYGKLGGYDDIVENAFFIERGGTGKLYYPMILTEIYDGIGEPLFLYAEEHLGITKDRIDTEGFQILINRVLELSDYGRESLPLPWGAVLEDYFPEGFSLNSIEDDKLYVIGDYADIPSLVTTSSYTQSPFYGVAGYEKVVEHCFIIRNKTIYYPKACSDAYAERYGFSGDNSGDPLWSYARSLGLVQSAISHTVAEAAELLIEYGDLPMPDISKYH